MTFTFPGALSPSARRVRAVLLVALLLASLFPAAGKVNVVGIAALLAAPVAVYEILRFLPRLHAVVWFVVPLFGVIAGHVLLYWPVNAYGQEKFSRFLTLTLVSALAACLLRDRAAVVTFARFWIVACLILAAFALAGWGGTERAGAFESNPVWLARALATALIAALWLSWRKLQHPGLMMIATAVLLLGLVATGSRGPLVGAVVGVVVLGVTGDKLKFHRLSSIVLAGAAAVFAIFTVPALQGGRLVQVLGEGGLTDETRNYFLDATLPVIARNPLGVGFGNWAISAGSPYHVWPHNLFLEVFAEMGIMAGVLLVSAVLVVVVRLVRRAAANPVAAGVLAMLVAETCAVCVSGDLNARTFFFLLTLGFLAGSKSPLGLDPAEPVRASARLQSARLG